jgi:ABC-2 type transport system permease protein
VVALICAGMSALVASQYQMIGGLLDESGMRALAENPAVRILSGPPVALDNAGGFTVWRIGIPVSLLASGWMVLAATRLTRGEEDGGRWDLLLAGRLRIVDVVFRYLAALVGSAMLIGIAVAVGLVAARAELVGSVIHATGMIGVALTFATTAVLAAQVMPRRAAATGLTVAALSVGLMLRMIADGWHQLAWLAWATPFGLAARAAPFADNRIAPLVVLSAFPFVLAGTALFAARHRDLGDGIAPTSDSRPPRTRLLRSISGFALRRAWGTTLGWATCIAASFFVVGALVTSILELFETNPRFAELAAAAPLGISVDVIAATLFSALAVPTGLYAAMRLAAMVADERTGRWTLLLAGPISRVRVVCTEIMVTVGAVVALHSTAAIAMWSGARISGTPVQLTDFFGGALNSLPVALLAAGAATLAAGWLPSAVGPIGALPVVGGFLLNVIVQTTHAPAWVVGLSPWTHLAAVPETPPNWAAVAILLSISAMLTALGVFGYVQRDLDT